MYTQCGFEIFAQPVQGTKFCNPSSASLPKALLCSAPVLKSTYQPVPIAILCHLMNYEYVHYELLHCLKVVVGILQNSVATEL